MINLEAVFLYSAFVLLTLTPSTSVKDFRLFEGTYCHHLQNTSMRIYNKWWVVLGPLADMSHHGNTPTSRRGQQ
jgi:hypothetical protein